MADDIAALTDQARSCMVAEGEATAAFEGAFAEALNVPHAVATGTGSQALLLALTALEVGNGDSVILPDYTCAEVLAVVRHAGALPIIVDIEDDYLLSVEAVAAAVTDSVKAIVLPYTMGIFRNASTLHEIGIPIIEDCAQFIDPFPHRINAIAGDMAIFSFEGTKLITAGEGGMIVTRHAEMADRIRCQKRFSDTNFKLNLFPLSDLQAALASRQLMRLAEMLARRAEIAGRYKAAFDAHPGVIVPEALAGRSLFFRYPLRLASAGTVDDAIAEFARRGIVVRRPVTPLLSAFQETRHPTPRANDLHARTLSLPIYPALTDGDVDRIIEATRSILTTHPNGVGGNTAMALA